MIQTWEHVALRIQGPNTYSTDRWQKHMEVVGTSHVVRTALMLLGIDSTSLWKSTGRMEHQSSKRYSLNWCFADTSVQHRRCSMSWDLVNVKAVLYDSYYFHSVPPRVLWMEALSSCFSTNFSDFSFILSPVCNFPSPYTQSYFMFSLAEGNKHK